jgi:predicted  nucleic acid-binding Zn-ribbon protein
MAWAYAVVGVVLGAIIMFGAIFAAKKVSGAGSSDKIATLIDQSASADSEIRGYVSRGVAFASKAQIDSVETQTRDIGEALEKQKALLKEIEQKLETAQKDVETKEGAQQEMKSAKEEDEAKLMQITSQFNTVKSDSVALEQELSTSLKSLDAMMNEVPMTADQRAVFQELSNAITSASSRLRDLITDYQSVNERLENLRAQHQDLEDEYTKLVEQQLGA